MDLGKREKRFGGEAVFVRNLSDAQESLLRFCVSLAGGDCETAKDVCQEANLRAWKLQRDFDPSRSSFRTWLFSIAKAQMRIERTRLVRERARTLYTEDLFERLAQLAQESELAQEDPRAPALRFCLGKLSPRDRRLLRRHYLEGETFAELAEGSGIAAVSMKMKFTRLRRALGECITKRMCRLAHGSPELPEEDLPFAGLLDDAFGGKDARAIDRLQGLLLNDDSLLAPFLEQLSVHAQLSWQAQTILERRTAFRAAARRNLRRAAIAMIPLSLFAATAFALQKRTTPEVRTTPPAETIGETHEMKTTQTAVAGAIAAATAAFASTPAFTPVCSQPGVVDARDWATSRSQETIVDGRDFATGLSRPGKVNADKPVGTVVILI